jgi:hypothetical protein
MKSTRVFIMLAGLACLVFLFTGSVAGLQTQTRRVTGDFTHASIAEVRDAQGRVLLRGEFVTGREDDDDEDEDADDQDDDANEIERSAVLLATGSDADATGEAEVEVDGSNQEIEFSVERIEPGAPVAFLIDGVELATKRANRHGRVELKLEVPILTRK